MSKIKPGPNKTRAGREVIVFTTSAKGSYPVIGIIHNKDCDDPASWTIDGRFNHEKEGLPCDLLIFADACEESR